MIKNITIAILIFSVVVSGASYIFVNLEFAVSVLLGGIMMLINLLGLAFVWRLIFSKKSIALAALIIIFKYIILGAILWWLVSINWLKPIGFLIGLSSLIFSIVLATLLKSRIQNI